MNILKDIDTRSLVGTMYITLGVIGFLCNLATVIMIISKRAFRLSAYTIMANVALADAIMLIVAGIICGINVIWTDFDKCLNTERTERTVELRNISKFHVKMDK